jgi:hypothetical protein
MGLQKRLGVTRPMEKLLSELNEPSPSAPPSSPSSSPPPSLRCSGATSTLNSPREQLICTDIVWRVLSAASELRARLLRAPDVLRASDYARIGSWSITAVCYHSAFAFLVCSLCAE